MYFHKQGRGTKVTTLFYIFHDSLTLSYSIFVPIPYYISLIICIPFIKIVGKQMIESERLQVDELRTQGFTDRQLSEMGYLQPSIDRAPAVAMRK